MARWCAQPWDYPRASLGASASLPLQHRISVSLGGVQSHPDLETGKRINIAVAASHFDGRRVGRTLPFSFWRVLGRPAASRGFVPGTEIRDGCVVPAVGGGLCLLSGALFRLAAEMGWTILERHGHTVQSSDLSRIDATVFWPQVDLRFAPPGGESVLRVRVQGDQLIVKAYGALGSAPVRVWREQEPAQDSNARRASRVLRAGRTGRPELLGIDRKRPMPRGLARNCLTCDQQGCSARPQLAQVLR